MFKYVVFSTGYVESESIAQIMFSPTEYNDISDLKTQEEVIENFAEGCFVFAYERKREYIESSKTKFECCDYIHDQKNGKYCPRCGKLGVVKKISVKEHHVTDFLTDYFNKIMGFTNDDFGDDIAGWTIYKGFTFPILEEEVVYLSRAEKKVIEIIKQNFTSWFEKYEEE